MALADIALDSIRRRQQPDIFQRRDARVNTLPGVTPVSGPPKGIGAGLDANYGDARLDGSQNAGGARGDARLDGSQNQAPSPLAAAPVQPASTSAAPPLAAPAAAPSVPAATSGGIGITPGVGDDLIQAQRAAVARGEAYKDGGAVHGPGTGTSDSIPARLSKGEFVVPADVVKTIGLPALQSMVANMHSQAKGQTSGAGTATNPMKLAGGGLVDREAADPSAADWNKLAAMYPDAQQPRYVAPAPGASLASQSLQQGIAQGAALLGGGRYGQQALVRSVDNQQTAAAPSAPAGPLAAAASQNNSDGYNATGGQAQVRAADNAMAAKAALAASATPAGPPAPPVDLSQGFGFRDWARGGAEPSTLDQGSGLTGARGNFIPAGVAGKPGEQRTVDYGYGDKITGTLDKDGRATMFSGSGGTSDQSGNARMAAQYQQGLATAAANKQALADIYRGQRTDLDQATLANMDNAQTSTRAAAMNALANAAHANAQASQVGSLTPAQVGHTQAQTAALQEDTQSKRELSPGQLALQQQAVKHGDFGLQLQSHITDLQKRAASTGPDAIAANNALALYQKAQSGKGGPITDEDILGAHKDMVVRAIQMGGPDSLKTLPSFNEYKSQLLGTAPAVPPQGAISLLKKDASPRNRALFEQQYGPGSADKYAK